jgi:type IV secretion system protein TrbB
MSRAREELRQRVHQKMRLELGSVVCGALEDPSVVEVMLNEDGTLWVERLGEPMVPVSEMPPHQAEALMTTVAATLETTITRDNPILECELPWDGSRFEALMPPVVARPVFTIRRRASRVFTLDEYVRQGVMGQRQRVIIEQAIEARQNILIVGGTGSGKTTLLNACIEHMARTSPDDRLVILEDTPEIQSNAKNRVFLRSTSNVDMLQLLKATLRLRPDRILVGEVRGAEALVLLKAWNTGHPGGVATVHANDARSGLERLGQLVQEAIQIPMQALIGEAVKLVVSIARTGNGRKVQEVVAVEGFDGEWLCRSSTTIRGSSSRPQCARQASRSKACPRWMGCAAACRSLATGGVS